MIYLYGAPGSGKTTLGKQLAAALDGKWIDLDAEIEASAGKTISEIFVSSGEKEFRRLEKETLKQIEADVVSLGGGTLLDPECRAWCESHGQVFCLETPEKDELERRLRLSGKRPLGDKSVERAEHYKSFASRVAASFNLQGSLILVGSNIARALMDPRKTVYDASIVPSGEKLAVIPSGERSKSVEMLEQLWHAFAKHGLGRRDVVASCGGGVVSDLVGFAAATWMRGIQWMSFPTTLLSMVDASVGGKTGVDLPEGKNLVGAFHPPKLVVIDTCFLETLPARELASGKAEMLKHQLVSGDRFSLEKIDASIIARSVAVKVGIVERDPFEKIGDRALLNCGHTIGHAVEAASEFKLSHGEAVAIGCVEEAMLASSLGLASKSWPFEVAELFEKNGLPSELPDGMTFESLVPLMLADKKKHNKSVVVFSLPCGFGDVRRVEIDLKALNK